MGRPALSLCLLLLTATSLLALPRTVLAQSASTGYLHTSGARLLDAQGNEVRITGVNWFGLETDAFAPHGLWARNYGDMLDQMAATGFNTIRLPYSNQLLQSSSMPQNINYQQNPDLQGLTGLQVMDRIIAAAGQRGMSVILDRHRPTAAGQTDLWYSNDVPESQWIQDWVMLAQRYAGNPTVIGADLHNEPHGAATWGDGNPATDWRLAAERAGNAILAVNPDWLILVEGIEHYGDDWYWWGGNLEGAHEAPVELSAPDKLVYSPHDYGPGVYQQRWFDAPSFPVNLPGIWLAHWAYLVQGDIAPVLVGEFGGRSTGSDPEGVWQRSLVDFLRTNDVSYTYWAWNPDSGDTGGILDDDWSTLDQSKLAMLAQSPVVASGESQTQAPVAAQAPTSEPAPDTQPVAAQVTTSQATPTTTPVAGSATSQPAEVTPPVAAGAATSQPAAATTTAAPTSTVVPVVAGTPNFAPGGPFDPDLQHALQGIGGPNDPDPVHRAAREQDERLYLADFGKPWQYAVYVTSATP
ncbi:MAG: glycoside hydrolase family 5 protein [Chloroflexi bacterium]|nr:glycoside hydrolase family 5 protein [Chloroflexota bacterium]